jgi:toxin-antitoxin system PIN domain toxin
MTLPDVNLLVHAHDLGSPRHDAARRWWDAALAGEELVALPWATVLGFIRITTNRAILRNPLPVDEAIDRVEEWLGLPHVRLLHPTAAHASVAFGFLRSVGAAGNLTTDAHLAALAVEHGCTLYTTDADFARFPGLKWRNPLTSDR